MMQKYCTIIIQKQTRHLLLQTLSLWPGAMTFECQNMQLDFTTKESQRSLFAQAG